MKADVYKAIAPLFCDRLLMLVVTGLAAVIQTALSVAHLAPNSRGALAQTIVIVDPEPVVTLIQLRINVALIVSMASVLFRRVNGLVLFLLASAWVLMEYIFWYAWSRKIKLNAGIDAFPSSVVSCADLYGAGSWNVLVLILVALGLSCGIAQLIGLVCVTSKR